MSALKKLHGIVNEIGPDNDGQITRVDLVRAIVELDKKIDIQEERVAALFERVDNEVKRLQDTIKSLLPNEKTNVPEIEIELSGE